MGEAPGRGSEAATPVGSVLDAGERPLRIAYVMSRFPKLTETFILFEMLAVEASGAEVELFPLLRERTSTMHPEARPRGERAHYLPFLSPEIVASQLWFLRHRPRRYLRTVASVLRGTLRSPNFFVGALGILPKTAHASRLMVELGVDHVHCHFANHPALAGYVIHRLTGLPYSFTAHGSDLHVDRTFLGPKVAGSTFVIAISEDNRREILETCGDSAADKVEVLHCGVDTGVFMPADRPPGPVGETRPLRILSIGTLHEVKGQAHLVEACRRLTARGVPVECTFVGDGPDRAALEARVADAGLTGRVRFSGQRTRAELVELLRRADVLAAPSVPTRGGKREGIPVVLMEAMAAGLPVVASRLSGIPELVADGESGLLVPPGDPDALAAALARLAADPALRSRLGQAARARVAADFDVSRNARRLVARIRACRTGHAGDARATAVTPATPSGVHA
jgi:colanic acid/amylovoran biosynthesis glycosyltransferase